MTALNGSERVIVDSSGWIEYLGEGSKWQAFAEYLEKPEALYLPTIIVYEVYKKLLREGSSGLAEQFLSQAFAFQEREIPLDIPVCALAAKISIELRLAMADAIIYASARAHGARLITSDTHFSGLPGVTLL